MEEKIKWLEEMKPFEKIGEDWCIPDIPILPKDVYEKYVIPNYIRCGAIPKKNLIEGKEYEGSCRNSGKAIWKGDHFEYIRYKFGSSYIDEINHFEDDDGHDLFIPMKEL